jgi:hypothetical protein
MSNENPPKPDSDVLHSILGGASLKDTIEQLGGEIAETLGEMLKQADVAVGNVLDDVGRGLAADEAEFQRKKREGK